MDGNPFNVFKDQSSSCNKFLANCWVPGTSYHFFEVIKSHRLQAKLSWDMEGLRWCGECVRWSVSVDAGTRRSRWVVSGTWTFQVAPEAGWARRKGPVTLLARLMPTAARRCRPEPRPLRTHAASQLQTTCVLIPLIKITMLENCTDDASLLRASQAQMINDYRDDCHK